MQLLWNSRLDDAWSKLRVCALCVIARCASSVGGEGGIARGWIFRWCCPEPVAEIVKMTVAWPCNCCGTPVWIMLVASSSSSGFAASPAARVALAEREGLRGTRFPRGGGFNVAAASRPLMPQTRLTFGASSASVRFAASPASRAALAEREGFEPPLPVGKAVFKTAAFDRSATSPKVYPANGARSYPKPSIAEALRDEGLPSGAKEIRTLDLRIANAAL